MNIELLTLCEVMDVSGRAGDFTVTLRQHPRYVLERACIGCGQCALACPRQVPDEHQARITSRKAIYVAHPQAVPLKYMVDPKACIALAGGSCSECVKVCPTGAIDFSQRERTFSVCVGAVVLAGGMGLFDPTGLGPWGYGELGNVITSMEMERYLAPGGPTGGRLVRPVDMAQPRRIAFVQCVGSRDMGRGGRAYCSSICCMQALKQALVAKEQLPGLEVHVFFVDLRAHGKDFERYYRRAVDSGVVFHRCRLHGLEPAPEGGGLYCRYITDEGKQVGEVFDLVVLSVGMHPGPSARALAESLGVATDTYGFVRTRSYEPVATNRKGIFACGCLLGPKDIPQSVTEASAAAGAVGVLLAGARHTRSQIVRPPAERDVAGEEPRIGVFICHCGRNIAGVVDVEYLAEMAWGLGGVMYVERTPFACSHETNTHIREKIGELGLNRIVVAACSPRTHEGLFRQTLRNAGLNESLLEMANIRNQAAWVHPDDPVAATSKAADLLAMAVAKASLLTPLEPAVVKVNPTALVIGGGPAGMAAALTLAEQGVPVHLVERTTRLGGNALHLFKTWQDEPVQPMIQRMIARVRTHPLITLHMGATVVEATGSVGAFTTIVRGPRSTRRIEHGAVIIAVGARPFYPRGLYGYGTYRAVFTALEFDKQKILGDWLIRRARSFVFIQCVGSREEPRDYCSRVCCTHSVQAALELKQEDPSREVFILYRDIRTYAQREELYHKARGAGVVFVNYGIHGKPTVRELEDERVEVVVWDHVLHEPLKILADVVVLATAVVPEPTSQELARMYKLPVDSYGFFQEAHAKLRPTDFFVDGVFMAGICHYPKPLEESIAQGQAAAARAAALLCRGELIMEPTKARVTQACDACGLCVASCPFGALSIVQGAGGPELVVDPGLCKGCGCCQASCPKGAIEVGGFTPAQLSAQVAAALEGW